MNTENQSTTALGSGRQTLAIAGMANFPGSRKGQRRKQFACANLDASAGLTIRNGGGASIGFVQPLTSWTMETDDDLQVFNANIAATCDYIVGEIFYTTEGYKAPGSFATHLTP